MKARYLPLMSDDLLVREGVSPLHIEERQPIVDSSPLYHSALQHHEGGESPEPVSGEYVSGVGCNGCDQETRAWNPRFMSMNYALSRLSNGK